MSRAQFHMVYFMVPLQLYQSSHLVEELGIASCSKRQCRKHSSAGCYYKLVAGVVIVLRD